MRGCNGGWSNTRSHSKRCRLLQRADAMINASIRRFANELPSGKWKIYKPALSMAGRTKRCAEHHSEGQKVVHVGAESEEDLKRLCALTIYAIDSGNCAMEKNEKEGVFNCCLSFCLSSVFAANVKTGSRSLSR